MIVLLVPVSPPTLYLKACELYQNISSFGYFTNIKYYTLAHNATRRLGPEGGEAWIVGVLHCLAARVTFWHVCGRPCACFPCLPCLPPGRGA